MTTAPDAKTPPVISPRRHMLLLAGTLFFIFAGAGAQQVYLVPYLGRVTTWEPVQCAAIITCVYLAMLVGRVGNVYLFPAWSDRRYTVVGSLFYLFFTLMMAATAWLRSYPVAVVSALLWGGGAAMMWTGTTIQTLAVADRAGGRHGAGMGILYAATHAGWLTGAIGLGVIYRLLTEGTYHRLYLAASLSTMAGILIATRLPGTAPGRRETPHLRELVRILVGRRALISGILLMTQGAAFGLILSVFGSYIETTFGKEFMWITISLYPAGLMAMSYLAGRLADRAGHARTLAIGFAIGALGLLTAVLSTTVAAAALAAASLSVFSSVVPVVATAMVGSAADRKRRPLAHGILFSWRDFGVAGTAVAARLFEVRFEFRALFIVCTLVFAACAAMAMYLERFADERF